MVAGPYAIKPCGIPTNGTEARYRHTVWNLAVGKSNVGRKSGFEPEGGRGVGKNLVDCWALRGFGFLTYPRPLLPRSPQCPLRHRWNVVELLVATGDSDGTQYNTRRLICVPLHPGTRQEQQVFPHSGCRKPEIPLRKKRGRCPRAPFPASLGVHKKRW